MPAPCFLTLRMEALPTNARAYGDQASNRQRLLPLTGMICFTLCFCSRKAVPSLPETQGELPQGCKHSPRPGGKFFLASQRPIGYNIRGKSQVFPGRAFVRVPRPVGGSLPVECAAGPAVCRPGGAVRLFAWRRRIW